MTEKTNETVEQAKGPWIHSRSKSYFGKTYYFNTLTGEAVWNLAEADVSI